MNPSTLRHHLTISLVQELLCIAYDGGMSTIRTTTVTDRHALAALAHPLRQRLIDLLTLDGPATVGTLAERTGQAAGNISHHLRVLATGGFIEEAPELASDRRQRWWRLTAAQIRWARTTFQSDPTASVVADAVGSLYQQRQLDIIRSWLTNRETYPQAWQDGCSVAADAWLRLTPDEARELSGQLTALLDEWASRAIPDDGQARESVFVCANVVPARP